MGDDRIYSSTECPRIESIAIWRGGTLWRDIDTTDHIVRTDGSAVI